MILSSNTQKPPVFKFLRPSEVMMYLVTIKSIKSHLLSSVFKSVEDFWVKIRAIERNLMVPAMDLGEEEEVDPRGLRLWFSRGNSGKTAQWC